MPPRKRVSAPSCRIYEATSNLRQTKLAGPGPKKIIKSYGKRGVSMLHKQDNTLTQIPDWLDRSMLDDDEEKEEDEEADLYGANRGDDVEINIPEVEPPSLRRSRKKVVVDTDNELDVPELVPINSKQKRRKTAGDELDKDEEQYMDEKEKRKKRRVKSLADDEYADKARKKTRRRKTIGDNPSPNSTFHTQTLTQMESWGSNPPLEEDGGGSIYDVPDTSSQVLRPHRKNYSGTDSLAKAVVIQNSDVSGSMGPPQTPRRKAVLEIPSSQSPATPLSDTRSPLIDLLFNSAIPLSFVANPRQSTNSNQLNLPKHPALVIQSTSDTEDSISTSIATSPPKRSSPAKSVRFAMDYEQEVADSEEPRSSPPAPVKSEPVSTQAPLQGLESSVLEIFDSDAESDFEEENNPCNIKEEEEEEQEGEQEEEEEAGDTGPETYYEGMDLETQKAAERLVISLSASHTQESQELRLNTEPTAKSQCIESQRISTQHAEAMAPQTSNSDIFISLHPPHVKNIANRKKDHEFRSWEFPDTVVRVWIYGTAPLCTLRYMAAVGPPKRPGDHLGSDGVGNAEFSTGFAYEILDLYELADPLSLDDLKAKEWLRAPPQKMQWVKPAVLGELMANLLPPIFTRADPIDEVPGSSSTDTQEATAQLFDTICQYTQPVSLLEVPLSDKVPAIEHIKPNKTLDEEVLQNEPSSNSISATEIVQATPSDQNSILDPDPELELHQIPRPSQAETVDLSQSQTPRHHALPDIIWESPTRPVPSSTPFLPTPRARGIHVADAPIPFPMSSSQLLTKSQMLPDSLIHDSVPGPPLLIQDSDEEDDDL
jgi:hypothetical protein